MDKSDDNIIKTLNVILNEAKNSRTELLQYSNENLNHIWKSLTFLTVFSGLLITFTKYALENCETLFILPLIFSSFGLVCALYLSITGTLPSKSLLVLSPDVLYEQQVEENEQLIKKVIQTYLIHNKKYMLQLEKKSFVREYIHIVTIGSISEFVIFVVSCIYNQYELIFKYSAWLLLIIIIIYVIYKKCDEFKEIDKLKRKLDID